MTAPWSLDILLRVSANECEFTSRICSFAARTLTLAKCKYKDIGDKFLTADGTLTTEIMADGLHPGS